MHSECRYFGVTYSSFNVSYSLNCAAELCYETRKTTKYSCIEGVLDSIYLCMNAMERRLCGAHLPTQCRLLTAFCSSERESLQGYYAVLNCLLSLAFTDL